MNEKEFLKSLGWSDELIAATKKISQAVSKSAVTERHSSEAIPTESNTFQSSSLSFESTNVSRLRKPRSG